MTDTLAVAGPARPSQRPAVSPWWALAVVLTGQFMAVLDASVVNVAAPSIHASLHTSGGGLQLVIAGYVITYAVLLVTGPGSATSWATGACSWPAWPPSRSPRSAVVWPF